MTSNNIKEYLFLKKVFIFIILIAIRTCKLPFEQYSVRMVNLGWSMQAPINALTLLCRKSFIYIISVIYNYIYQWHSFVHIRIHVNGECHSKVRPWNTIPLSFPFAFFDWWPVTWFHISWWRLAGPYSSWWQRTLVG